ncbi:uncharacterized protein LOC142321239 [Lycorma delicatula]|uniref:uncharacterized protein LOC142321239 n=1 Tax=Lycorma delicatula TaxID=130591 RepID=UPI003F51A9C9
MVQTWKPNKTDPVKKSSTPDAPVLYTPVYLTNNFCKLLERMLVRHILEDIRSTGGFHKQQFGFREKHSKVEAVQMIIEWADWAVADIWRTRKIPLLVTHDIKKTFNSL